MGPQMDSTLPGLRAFFEQRRARSEPLALATVIATEGSTYRKPGARMLFARDGQFAGLLSGGCLETDLQLQAKQVIEQRRARIVEYDSRTSDDAIWGLGLGCEGAMRILVQPLSSATQYDPLPRLVDPPRERICYALIVASTDSAWPLGRCWFADEAADSPVARELAVHCRGDSARIVKLAAGSAIEAFVGSIEPATRLLLLGGGPDALAVVRQAALLGWRVTVVDHRAAYADAARLGTAERALHAQPDELPRAVRIDDFDAAVVMSHHLPSDLAYLRALADAAIGYVGLLGPAARRERLRQELGSAARQLEGRLFGPVGLDIGAVTPEAIALAIVAEIHAHLRGRDGRSFSVTVRT